MQNPPQEGWYYRAFGEEHGPISSARVAEMVASGDLTPESMVRLESATEWTPAHEALPGLVKPDPARGPRGRGRALRCVFLMAIGVVLIGKALFLPLPIPPSTGFVSGQAPWAATYLHQVRHWQEQKAHFDQRQPSGSDAHEKFASRLGQATTRNLHLAWIYLIASSGLGLLLIAVSIYGMRTSSRPPAEAKGAGRPGKASKALVMGSGMVVFLAGIPSLLAGSWDKLAVYWFAGAIAFLYGLRMKTQPDR